MRTTHPRTAITGLTLDRAKARLQGTLEEYWFLDSHLRRAEDTNFRVCLFGSARITATDPLYYTVFDLSCALAARGMDIVTGGGPGLMEAANAGVQAARQAIRQAASRSYGLTLEIPTLAESPNRHLDITSRHRKFSSRLDEFVRLSHGIVVAPGGIGTLLELMYLWQLLQVHMIESRPVVLFGSGFWSGLLQWMEHTQVAGGFMSPWDLEYVKVVDSVEEAVAYMALAYQQYRESAATLAPAEIR